MSEEEQAAIRIQKVYRMWKAKTFFQQLTEYKVQKQNQLIFFCEQVEEYGNELCELIETTNQPVEHRSQHRRASMEPPPKNVLSYGEARTNQMERMSTMKQPWTTDDELYYKRLLVDMNAKNEYTPQTYVPSPTPPPIEIENDEDTYTNREALKEECDTEELLDRLEQDETNQRFRKWQALRRLIAFASGAAAAAAEAKKNSSDHEEDDATLQVAQAFFEKGNFTDPSEIL